MKPWLNLNHPEQQYYYNTAVSDSPRGPLSSLSLSSLDENEYTVLSDHPLYPNYNVRIKKSRFCDETVNGFTGYIDIEARHLFFYFFESRSDPDKDDVIFWTNGGPGCSSSLGLFFELGPCRIPDETGPKFHPESWNSNANIFFIDQPVGVGFSYAEFGETVSTSEEAAVDIAAFVSIFFDHFTQFEGRGFHMAGESYGGRYIPLFASAVYDNNARRVDAGLSPINLKSAMIGNGMTDSFKMIPSYYDMACTPASIKPFVDISSCVQMKQIADRCDKWMKKACVDHFDHIDCAAAYNFCQLSYAGPFYATGKNPYDISKPCEGGLSSSLCYPETSHVLNYLNNATNRQMMGVDSTPTIPKNMTSCTPFVSTDFALTGDILHPTTHYVSALLERGIRVLIYVGAYDWICNHVGNERWVLGMEWSGKEEFGSVEKREWVFDGERAGVTRSAKGLTFATIDGAGHMVPHDKPKQALAMVQRWLANEDL
ncbi:hypothetical protein AGABI2DRAFT_69247 [Agaricus bisporus var. bisporus H97]|uniref:hypothetical protein n=1 Tax=Agaricus bisporus var. bisporus (strain H97 / ATCC MYA-4626 / FGSC 10389) TaxID=936046 RepID=UPI00029F60EF|nr:hypothetical protein AGABI2DRAFT_69247 [Agaricus bisporus var. bisporus H97]EKV47847.1 hypothetical protein AGABI2DRAFT_69247 [Agaricus bisporus var. bisporus H97]